VPVLEPEERLLFGLIAGPLADRGNRRRLLVGGNVVEGTLVSTIPIAHLLGVVTVLHIYAVALLSASAFVLSDAAALGALPALVGSKRLPAANGMLPTLASMTEIAAVDADGNVVPRRLRPRASPDPDGDIRSVLPHRVPAGTRRTVSSFLLIRQEWTELRVRRDRRPLR
jgi:hypothetical protein